MKQTFRLGGKRGATARRDVAPETQAAIRAELSKILDSHGLHELDLEQRRAFEVTQKIPSGAVWLHDGRIKMRPGFAEKIAAFSKDDRTLAAQYAFMVFVHEGVHGTSPLDNAAFYGIAKRIEEGTTEIVARRIAAKLGAFHYEAGAKSTEGGYQDMIDWLSGAISDGGKMSLDEAHQVLEGASFGMRQKKHEPAQTIHSYVDIFIGHLAVPPDAQREIRRLLYDRMPRGIVR